MVINLRHLLTIKDIALGNLCGINGRLVVQMFAHKEYSVDRWLLLCLVQARVACCLSWS
jgi:hypothetical protein